MIRLGSAALNRSASQDRAKCKVTRVGAHSQVNLLSEMATKVSSVYEASSKLAKYPFEPYWPSKLKICVTGAGGFIASYVDAQLGD